MFITYKANPWSPKRHLCTDTPVPEDQRSHDADDLRHEPFDGKRKQTLPPCCWNTYCRTHS